MGNIEQSGGVAKRDLLTVRCSERFIPQLRSDCENVAGRAGFQILEVQGADFCLRGYRIYAIYNLFMAKKTYIAVKKVRQFIDVLSDEVQAEYLKIVEQLEKDGRLVEPYGKKLDKGLFEIRIRRGGQIRVLYFYQEKEYIVGVHGFVKKTQKTPQKELKQAFKVMGLIKRGEYDE